MYTFVDSLSLSLSLSLLYSYLPEMLHTQMKIAQAQNEVSAINEGAGTTYGVGSSFDSTEVARNDSGGGGGRRRQLRRLRADDI